MEVGEVFANRYIVQRELARAASGNVYLAQDQNTKERVAIKLLPALAANYALWASRMRREAELTARMQGNRFTRIYEHGQTPSGDSFLIMEYLRGQPLSEILRHEAPLTVSRTASLARQTLEALVAAHQQGAVHRDLKPTNIFVCDTADGGYVKVLDFGAAAASGSAGNAATTDINKLTARDSGLGTPDYMSPEQCRGGVVTAASDIYSLGIVLFEALTGASPFKDPNPVQVMLMQLSRPAPALPDEIARTPLGRAVMTALEKDPAARFATAQAFLDAINSAGQTAGSREQTARAPQRQTLMLTGSAVLTEATAKQVASAAGTRQATADAAARRQSSSPATGPIPVRQLMAAGANLAAEDRRAPARTQFEPGAAASKSKMGLIISAAIAALLALLVASIWLLD